MPTSQFLLTQDLAGDFGGLCFQEDSFSEQYVPCLV